MTTEPDTGIEVARITITRVLSPEGKDQVWFEAVDSSGEPLALVESLGLLRMSEDTAIRAAMGRDDDADEL